jgi:uncharacterized protein
MDRKHFLTIATELSIKASQVTATVELLDGGATIPFISRYRKELTGSLDEVFVMNIRNRIQQLRDLDSRKEAILKSIKEQEKLTPELEAAIHACENMASLEDLYLPYKPKRKTKASIAREKGLEPLSTKIFDQKSIDIEALASEFINAELGVNTVEEALQGARDIMAEHVNEDQEARKNIREIFAKEATVKSVVIKGKEVEGVKYKDYFEWSEPLSKIPSHRLLAIRRGEREMILSVDIFPEEESAVAVLNRQFVLTNNDASEQVKIAVKDSYKRLLRPSMETESRMESKKLADQEAINVFTDNLRQLLLSAPLGQKNVLGVDPGFRSGCKIVCLDRQGKLLENATIYPNEPQKAIEKSATIIKAMVEKHKIEAVAIGNGTASRESEQFFRGLGLSSSIIIAMVNESGASIYSASDVAREEFPDHDLTVRGAVSIGRRMMDPLAELVKIDPKSIGVGQYQHDVDQNALKSSLDDVVMNCVNAVGVELNTASKQLLSYVSGLGPALAENIVKYRNENGPFESRAALKKVPRLGDKAFEQSAGFLRIRGGKNVLDGSAVHPERYGTVEKMAKDVGAKVEQLVSDGSLRAKINLKSYISDDLGLPTLQDILEELNKPGRDPRQQFEVFQFEDSVHEISDVRVGMKLPGLVTNITKFGAFVDIGVHQDGLVHISHISDSFVSDPSKALKLQQKVMVTVTEVDIQRKRIALSLKSDPFGKGGTPSKGASEKNAPAKRPIERTTPRSVERKPETEKLDMKSSLALLKGKFGK